MSGLLTNLRFYILLFSAVLAGAVYFFIGMNDSLPGGGLLSMIQWYALIAVTYLYFALLASPLVRIFTWLPYRAQYIFARRAIGVSGFLFGLMHATLAFFFYLGGLEGVFALDTTGLLAVSAGATALTILFLMASTSFDFMIVKLGSSRWKFLHRFFYLAAFLIVIHALLLGSHFANLSDALPLVFFTALVFLLLLESIRFNRYLEMKFLGIGKFFIPQIFTLLILIYSALKIFNVI